MTNEPTLTPNSGGWNCTSADGKIEVYGETKAEAVANLRVAQLYDALFKLRAAVDGLAPGYVYLRYCKAIADAALALGGMEQT